MDPRERRKSIEPTSSVTKGQLVQAGRNLKRRRFYQFLLDFEKSAKIKASKDKKFCFYCRFNFNFFFFKLNLPFCFLLAPTTCPWVCEGELAHFVFSDSPVDPRLAQSKITKIFPSSSISNTVGVSVFILHIIFTQ